MWRIALADHPDTTLVDHIEFSFPSNYSAPRAPRPTFTNHKDYPAYARHIAEYVETELCEGALLGPFDVPPFTLWAQCSPIMTRPKSTPGKRRIIVDLSFPPSASVNVGIPRREYLGIPHSYWLPSIAELRG